MRLYLARHGESTGNAQRLIFGQRDYPLTERGRAQARELGRSLEGAAIVRVVASPLSRALETARLACPNVPIETDARLMEQSMGRWEGMTEAEVLADDTALWQAMLADWTRDQAAPPEGESYSALRQRVSRAIDEILSRGGDTLIVAHAGVLAALYNLLLKEPREKCAHERFPCARAIVIEASKSGAAGVAPVD